MENFVITVCKARQQKRPMLHSLLNYLATCGLFTAVISTNLDGLEFMQLEDLPANLPNPFRDPKSWENPMGWLGEHRSKIIHLHGTIADLVCTGCSASRRIDPATLSQKSFEPCSTCRGGALDAVWAPQIDFCQTDRSAEIVEHQGPKSTTTRQHGKAPADSGSLALAHGHYEREDYVQATSTSNLLMRCVFIIGCSLSSPQLRKDMEQLSKLGIQPVVVNKSWSPNFQGLKNCHFIEADAEEFAEHVFNKLSVRLLGASIVAIALLRF